MRSLLQQQTSNFDLSKVQDNVRNVLESISELHEIVNGRLIKDIAIVSGTAKIISHELSRKLKGWIVVRKSANSTIWDSQLTNTNPKTTLVLQASANVTVSLWVF